MSKRVVGVRQQRRESEAVTRALETAFKRGFRNGFDAAFFAMSESSFSIAELARASEDTENAVRARVERGARAFVDFSEGRYDLADMDSMAEAMGGLLLPTVHEARAKLEEEIMQQRGRHVVAQITDDSTAATNCVVCGVKLPPPSPTGRPRRYCSSRCRAAAFRAGL